MLNNLSIKILSKFFNKVLKKTKGISGFEPFYKVGPVNIFYCYSTRLSMINQLYQREKKNGTASLIQSILKSMFI